MGYICTLLTQVSLTHLFFSWANFLEVCECAHFIPTKYEKATFHTHIDRNVACLQDFTIKWLYGCDWPLPWKRKWFNHILIMWIKFDVPNLNTLVNILYFLVSDTSTGLDLWSLTLKKKNPRLLSLITVIKCTKLQDPEAYGSVKIRPTSIPS
jgi:hypothetical protein